MHIPLISYIIQYPFGDGSVISTSFELPKEDPEAVRKFYRARKEPMAVFLRRLIGRELASVKAIEVDDVERRALGLADNGRKRSDNGPYRFYRGVATVKDERMCAKDDNRRD